jgi:glycosyltransferase involved in cell wall biosynthesis
MTWCLAAVGLCIVGLTPDTALVLVVLLCLFPGRALLFLVTMSWMVYPGYDVTMAWFWIVVPFAVLAVRHPWLNDPPWHPCREAPASLDIIVPVLNEGGRIAETLAALESATDAVDMDTRIIVVDGGSSDDTVDRARAHGAHVIQCQKAGRGSQIAAGLEAGSGELVVILHADAMIRRDALQRLSNLMKSRPRLQWGVLGHVYDRSDAGMRIVELRNRLRFAYTGLAFGDQGIFVRRDILDEVGFPALRLMEDVELSLRLAPYPCRANLVDSLTVSARAWESRPLLSYPLQVSSTVIGYLFRRRLGADIRRLSNELYKKYYGRE